MATLSEVFETETFEVEFCFDESEDCDGSVFLWVELDEPIESQLSEVVEDMGMDLSDWEFYCEDRLIDITLSYNENGIDGDCQIIPVFRGENSLPYPLENVEEFCAEILDSIDQTHDKVMQFFALADLPTPAVDISDFCDRILGNISRTHSMAMQYFDTKSRTPRNQPRLLGRVARALPSGWGNR